MLDLAQVRPSDTLYDLGCGDGRIVIGAARRGAAGVGFDIDRLRVREGVWNAERAGVTDRVRFVRQSLYDVDLRPATVVSLFLLPSINRNLRPKLLRELRTGSRVVSNYFDMAEWPPDARSEAWGRQLYLWLIPAWVEGHWTGMMNAPHGRTHLTLPRARTYQKVSGTIRIGRHESRLEAGRLAGDRLTFSYTDPASRQRIDCDATADSTTLRGSARVAEGNASTPWPWCAWRDLEGPGFQ
jgi:SAM-dependent methyltransferase